MFCLQRSATPNEPIVRELEGTLYGACVSSSEKIHKAIGSDFSSSKTRLIFMERCHIVGIIIL